jgi:hypothetical protein
LPEICAVYRRYRFAFGFDSGFALVIFYSSLPIYITPMLTEIHKTEASWATQKAKAFNGGPAIIAREKP